MEIERSSLSSSTTTTGTKVTTSSIKDIKEEIVDDDEKDIVIVYIPSIVSDIITNVTVRQKKGAAFEVLTSYCKSHFSQVKSKLDDKGLNIFKEQIKSHAGNNDNISDDLVERLSSMSSCEIIPLHPNSIELGYIAVNMYVDDKGIAKGLDYNPRASAIAQACGLDVKVFGDAFVAKQFDNDRGFYRIDFSTKDLDGDSEWVKKARLFNMKKKSSNVSGPTIHNLSPNNSNETVVNDLLERANKNKAEKLKKEGNELYSKKLYSESIEKYSEGLQILESEKNKTSEISLLISTLLCNRSLVYYKMGKFDLSLNDADKCISIDNKSVKGWCRKGDSLLALNNNELAKSSFQYALELEPNILDLKKRLSSLT